MLASLFNRRSVQTKSLAVDAYYEQTLLNDVALSEALTHAHKHSRDNGLPNIAVSPLQGKFLQQLVQISGTERILEVGTLGGYSAIWLASALPASGKLITLEIDPDSANVAKENLAHANLSDKVDVIIGAALESLATLKAESVPPFDFVFIDADKVNNANYLQHACDMTSANAIIIVDNVVRGGEVTNAESTDESIIGTRAVADYVSKHENLSATVLQTVGNKGYDGFMLIRKHA